MAGRYPLAYTSRRQEFSEKSSPYLKANMRLNRGQQEIRVSLQGIDEEIRILGRLIEVLVLSEIEVIKARQGHCPQR